MNSKLILYSYVDEAGSMQMNLTYASSTSAVLRVDTSETNAITGRKSVRIESKNQYNDGLFIFDILHTPYGCGTWPAVWLTDPANWPNHGEIGGYTLAVIGFSNETRDILTNMQT